jgi:uroporphyrin-III C-methyltransferase/precorrin-2 dehydrogenase/sirohydrochlorin ferrochelatase
MALQPVFPVFLKLEGRRVLLVGGGRVAAGKVRPLLDAGASVTVVAPAILPEIAAAGVSFLVHRRFAPADLDGVWYVVAAAPAEVNAEVAREAHARRIFVNAVDDVENASAYAGGIVRRAGVTVAVSTGGDAPAIAGLLREALEHVLPEDLDRWMTCARDARRQWLSEGVPMADRRPLLLEALFDLYRRRGGESPLSRGPALRGAATRTRKAPGGDPAARSLRPRRKPESHP